MNVTLLRIAENEHGTFGVMIYNNQPICCTLEEPWRNNQNEISCIPLGTYQCKPHSGPKKKNVWILEGVPNRTGILIHTGNTIENTEGCILVGRQFTPFGVILSQMALDDIKKLLPSNFTLTIKDCK